jgi:hypothetical protein
LERDGDIGEGGEWFGDLFLYDCYELEQIDLKSLSNVTLIGSNFLVGCEKLTEINLSGFSLLKEIGDGFLYKFEKLAKYRIISLNCIY